MEIQKYHQRTDGHRWVGARDACASKNVISAASVPVVATQLNWAPTCEIDKLYPVNYRFAPILGMFKVSPTKFV